MFRVGFKHLPGGDLKIVKIFVGSPARAEDPHGGASYVQVGGQNRIDPHWGRDKRPTAPCTLIVSGARNRSGSVRSVCIL